jgi:hypothetical protein
MTKLEQVRAKIIEAVPEIMEYRCNGCNRRYAEYVNGCPRCWIDEWSREKNYERYPNRHVGLTPRSIRLADVLIAVWSHLENYELPTYESAYLPSRFTIASDGDMFCDLPKAQIANWNLHKDSLDDQSEETINFLHDILCNQKT